MAELGSSMAEFHQIRLNMAELHQIRLNLAISGYLAMPGCTWPCPAVPGHARPGCSLAMPVLALDWPCPSWL